MPVKKLRPLINSMRNTILIDYRRSISKVKPEKTLLRSQLKTTGRNNQGKITVRHRGGGTRAKYRMIDFKRNLWNLIGTVKTIEYDPNRNAFISLIFYPNGVKRYILTPKNLALNDRIVSSETAEIKPGNALPLHAIPEGTFVHNIELRPFQGGKLVRSAGSWAQIAGLDDTQRYMILKLPSGETRKVLKTCWATIGQVGNEAYRLLKLGKAGRNRWKGIRPTVRGAAMNRCDHPHGGGEGKSPIGRDAPRTKWGKKFMGIPTRDKKKFSNQLILRRRRRKK